jgi:hypothetical protein
MTSLNERRPGPAPTVAGRSGVVQDLGRDLGG